MMNLVEEEGKGLFTFPFPGFAKGRSFFLEVKSIKQKKMSFSSLFYSCQKFGLGRKFLDLTFSTFYFRNIVIWVPILLFSFEFCTNIFENFYDQFLVNLFYFELKNSTKSESISDT